MPTDFRAHYGELSSETLQQYIADILKESGDISSTEGVALRALGRISGWDDSATQALIDQEVAAFQTSVSQEENFLAFIDEHLTRATPDEQLLRGLYVGGEALGWDKEKVDQVVAARIASLESTSDHSGDTGDDKQADQSVEAASEDFREKTTQLHGQAGAQFEAKPAPVVGAASDQLGAMSEKLAEKLESHNAPLELVASLRKVGRPKWALPTGLAVLVGAAITYGALQQVGQEDSFSSAEATSQRIEAAPVSSLPAIPVLDHYKDVVGVHIPRFDKTQSVIIWQNSYDKSIDGYITLANQEDLTIQRQFFIPTFRGRARDIFQITSSKDGSLYALARGYPESVWIFRSTDRGASWHLISEAGNYERATPQSEIKHVGLARGNGHSAHIIDLDVTPNGTLYAWSNWSNGDICVVKPGQNRLSCYPAPNNLSNKNGIAFERLIALENNGLAIIARARSGPNKRSFAVFLDPSLQVAKVYKDEKLSVDNVSRGGMIFSVGGTLHYANGVEVSNDIPEIWNSRYLRMNIAGAIVSSQEGRDGWFSKDGGKSFKKYELPDRPIKGFSSNVFWY